LVQIRSAAIRGDRQKPWAKGTFPIPSLQASNRPDKHILSRILSFLTVAEHTETNAEH
jgi:hypothetical protein